MTTARTLPPGRQRVAPAVWLGSAGPVSRRIAGWVEAGGMDLLVVDGAAVPLSWLLDAAPLLSILILDGAWCRDLPGAIECCRQVRCRASKLPFLLVAPATGWTGPRGLLPMQCDAVLRLPADEEEFWIALALAGENRTWAQEMTRRRHLPDDG